MISAKLTGKNFTMCLMAMVPATKKESPQGLKRMKTVPGSGKQLRLMQIKRRNIKILQRTKMKSLLCNTVHSGRIVDNDKKYRHGKKRMAIMGSLHKKQAGS